MLAFSAAGKKKAKGKKHRDRWPPCANRNRPLSNNAQRVTQSNNIYV